MSEMIDEVLIDRIHEVAPSYPLERVHFMLDKFPDRDVFIECTSCTPYLIVRTSPETYSFFGPYKESTWCASRRTSDSEWCEFLRHSYKIVRDAGALPYAHRS